MTSEQLPPDNSFSHEYEREIGLYPAIRQAHFKMQMAQKRDRAFEMLNLEDNRRFAFWSDDETLPVKSHVRFTLTPDARKGAIADVQRIVVRVPMAENVIATAGERKVQGTEALMPTYDFVAELFNGKGDSIAVLVNQEGMKPIDDFKSLAKTSEEDLLFDGHQLTLIPNSGQSISQAELEEEWVDIFELQSILETYLPEHQDNAGTTTARVA